MAGSGAGGRSAGRVGRADRVQAQGRRGDSAVRPSHNLCEVVEDFLSDLGVDKLPEQDVVITLRIPEGLLEYSSDPDVSIEDIVGDQLGDILANALNYQRVEYIQNIEFVDKKETSEEGTRHCRTLQ